MRRALVNFQLGDELLAEAVLRDHSPNRFVNEFFRMAFTELLNRSVFLTALPTRVTHIKLLGFLLASHAHLLRVDHDYKIAGVPVRREDRLGLAAKDSGDS